MKQNKIILGIETSCDETAVAIVDSNKKIHSNIVFSQLSHEKFGGVIPEVAARAHLEILPNLISKSLEETSLSIDEIDAFAATSGPGLIGGVIVGMMMAKGLSASTQKPFIAINHLEAHALTPRLCYDELTFPYLLLLVSGGHTQILLCHDVGHFQLLGTTIDDALGEAFDKVAKMMNFPYPGGPIIEKLALNGDVARFSFPRPLIHRADCHFSFSGLKTAVKNQIQSMEKLSEQDTCDIAASFQAAVLDVLIKKLKNAFDLARNHYPNISNLVIAGGVAANKKICGALEALSKENNFLFYAPPLSLCTDNAAMVAWAGVERFEKKLFNNLDFQAKPRWPLEELKEISL